MRVVLQRVSQASVTIEGKVSGQIGMGLLLLAGIEEADTQEDIDWLARKIPSMRIFSDDAGHMNLSLQDVDGDILLVSQFTLHAKTKKGNRPSFIKAARPEVAIPMYENLIKALANETGKTIQTGEFGAMMQVSLINDGPVTILLDTKNKE